MSFELEPWQFSQGLIDITTQIPIDTYPEEDSVLSGDYDELLNATVIKRSERWRKHNWFIKQCKTANWEEMDDLDKELFLLTVLDMDLLYTQAMLDADAAYILRQKQLLKAPDTPPQTEEPEHVSSTSINERVDTGISTEASLRAEDFPLEEYELFTEEGVFTGTIVAMFWHRIKSSKSDPLAVCCNLSDGSLIRFHVWKHSKSVSPGLVNKEHSAVHADTLRCLPVPAEVELQFVKRNNPKASKFTPLVGIRLLD